MIAPGAYIYFLEGLGILSVLTFAGSLIVVPWLIARLPADYFIRHRYRVEERHRRHPLLTRVIFVLRNGIGTVFLLAGVAMLVLPGQGVLTILLGISLMDFPGKHRLLEFLMHRPRVIRSLNWIRRRVRKPPFVFEPESGFPHQSC